MKHESLRRKSVFPVSGYIVMFADTFDYFRKTQKHGNWPVIA